MVTKRCRKGAARVVAFPGNAARPAKAALSEPMIEFLAWVVALSALTVAFGGAFLAAWTLR